MPLVDDLPAPTPAVVVREYGPLPDVTHVHGVSHDGRLVWAATDERLIAIDPESGAVARALVRRNDAGTAFDGRHLYQLADDRIEKIDPTTGEVVATIPAPGREGNSGLTWAEGSLWVGEYHARRIHQVDPASGALLRTIESNRHVTGVTWVDGELWHGTWESDESEIRRVDPASGAVQTRLRMPAGAVVSGLEAAPGDLFYAGGGPSGTVRAVRRPRGAQG
ncbi:MAG: hypothetical protein AB7I01_15965 [Gammaproteobacteria bacterium]